MVRLSRITQRGDSEVADAGTSLAEKSIDVDRFLRSRPFTKSRVVMDGGVLIREV